MAIVLCILLNSESYVPKIHHFVFSLTLFSCTSKGIPLETQLHTKSNIALQCQATEIRTFRVLFLLPVYHI